MMMKEIKKTLNYQEFLKVMSNPPCKLNMELDKLLQDRFNNNSCTLYQRNEMVLLKSKDCNGKIKNILDKKWKEEREEVKEFFRILAVEGNRRFKSKNQRSRSLPSPQPPSQPRSLPSPKPPQSLPSPQSPPQPQSLPSPKNKLPLLLPRPPLPQPRVYYQPQSYEYYQPQQLSPPQLQSDEYWKMHQLSDTYRSQQLPLHYEQCIPAVTLPLYPQPQSSPPPLPQSSLPQPYANYQPVSYEDNQPQFQPIPQTQSPPPLPPQSSSLPQPYANYHNQPQFQPIPQTQSSPPLPPQSSSLPQPYANYQPVLYEDNQPQLQLQPQTQSSPPPQSSLHLPYANYQPISYEDNQPQPLLSPSQLQTDESCWQIYQFSPSQLQTDEQIYQFPDEYYLQPLPLQQPFPDDEQYEQPHSLLPYEVYFNDFN